ncbi:MAG: metalloregulator ArsR/SmtB family transcription factor [Eubacteriales bacterium]|nr:metalloregulator ArsR/SmtB family transcription factor [Eubacteriales bacterium]
MASSYEENAKVFKALCDEKRLKILEFLQDGERCVCTLYEPLGLPQSTLSYHLKILCESGIVEGRQEGKWTFYHISEAGSRAAAELLVKLTTVTPGSALQEPQYSCAT